MGRQAGRQTDKIWVGFEIFVILDKLGYLDFSLYLMLVPN